MTQFEALERVGKVWAKHPELRLGQLIGNVWPTGSGNDPYYLVDEKFVETLEKFYDKANSPV